MPSDDLKTLIRPGDQVKLMWSVARFPGERMWGTVAHRRGDRLVGTLDNYAIFAFLKPDEEVKFHIDDIIDCAFDEPTIVGDLVGLAPARPAHPWEAKGADLHVRQRVAICHLHGPRPGS